MQSYLREYWRDVTSALVVAGVLVIAITGGHIGQVMQTAQDAADRKPDAKQSEGRAVFRDTIGSVTPVEEAPVVAAKETVESDFEPSAEQQQRDAREAQAEQTEQAEIQTADDPAASPEEWRATQAANAEQNATVTASTPPAPTPPRLPKRLRDLPSEEVVEAVRASHRELMEEGKLQLFLDLRGLRPGQINAIVEFYVFPLSRNDKLIRVSPAGDHDVIQRDDLPDGQLNGPLERDVVWPEALANVAVYWLAKRHKADVQFYLNPQSAFAVFGEIRRRNPAPGSTLYFRVTAGKRGDIKFQLDKIEKPQAKSVASASVTAQVQPEE